MISFVIPAHNEEGNVVELHRRIKEEALKLGTDFEILFVNDGSIDRTDELLRTLFPVRVLRLANRSGQTAALDAGIQAAFGDIIITMDGDLQNDPADIPKFLEKLKEGSDVVGGWRVKREDNVLWRTLPSKAANWLTSQITGIHLNDYACGFKAYRAPVIKRIRIFGEVHRFLPALANWQGARVTEIPITHHERVSGVTKYKFPVAPTLFFDLLAMKFCTRYQTKPIHVFGWFGTAFILVGFLSVLVYGLLGDWWRGFVLGSLFLCAGVLAWLLGLVAELLARVYFVSGGVPYAIAEEFNTKDNNTVEHQNKG